MNADADKIFKAVVESAESSWNPEYGIKIWVLLEDRAYLKTRKVFAMGKNSLNKNFLNGECYKS